MPRPTETHPAAPLGGITRRAAARLGWTSASYAIIGCIAGLLMLVMLFWWPLVLEYFAQWDWSRAFLLQVDWLLRLTDRGSGRVFDLAYWPIFLGFCGLLLSFVGPTLEQPLSALAVAVLLVLIFTPQDRRMAVLVFLALSLLR